MFIFIIKKACQAFKKYHSVHAATWASIFFTKISHHCPSMKPAQGNISQNLDRKRKNTSPSGIRTHNIWIMRHVLCHYVSCNYVSSLHLTDVIGVELATISFFQQRVQQLISSSSHLVYSHFIDCQFISTLANLIRLIVKSSTQLGNENIAFKRPTANRRYL